MGMPPPTSQDASPPIILCGMTRNNPQKFAARIKSLQRRMADWNVDALLVTNPRDIRYLTGFVGHDSWLLVRQRSVKVHVLSDFRFDEQIKNQAPHVAAIMRKATLVDELKKLAERLRVDHIALPADHVTLTLRQKLAKAMGAKRFKTVDDGLLQQRAVKSDAEVRAITKALRIAEQAYIQTCDFMKPGMTEYEVAAYLEYRMRALGADGRSFPTIIAADANAALPHAIPGPRKLREGGIVLIDWGARYGGYCSDLTRVVAFGNMSRKMREIYAIVLEAQMAAIDAIAPGKAMADIDKVARDIIVAAGYGKQFGHSLGHGIGLDIHEQPVLAARAKGELQPGHVVTVEPGIYLPGVGGVRIEDDVLVTAKGHRVLSRLPKGLEAISL
jgi:Xaa-Pro aminopeptidase